MADRRHEPTARKIVEQVEHARDPDAALAWAMQRLDRQIESAEQERQHSEALLIEVMAKLERIARAKRTAERAQRDVPGLRWQQHEEQLRAARNARRRQRYRERMELHPSGSGRSVRIEVDPTAWRAMRAEAARRRIPAKALLADVALAVGALESETSSAAPGPRWRRTGDGRRARHSTVIDIDDDAWVRVRARAVLEGLTIARFLGRTVEAWVAEQHGRNKRR